jgi:hypothetical protein
MLDLKISLHAELQSTPSAIVVKNEKIATHIV